MESTQAVHALAALAQPTRLEAFRALVRAGRAGATPGELAAALDVPPSTLSFHLKELRAAGLVVRRREARTLRDAADFGAMGELLRFLTDQCCRGLALREPRGARAPADPRNENENDNENDNEKETPSCPACTPTDPRDPSASSSR